MSDDKAAAILNAALEQQRLQHGGEWEEVAKRLGVNRETIWRWRKGKFGKATRVLVELVAQAAEPRT